jgi:hypothetical protein
MKTFIVECKVDFTGESLIQYEVEAESLKEAEEIAENAAEAELTENDLTPILMRTTLIGVK